MKKLTAVFLSILLVFTFATPAFAADVSSNEPFENSSYFTDGSYTLHYRVYDPATPNGKQMILLHGFCLSTVSFEGLAQEYADAGYKVVLADLPNFGYSSRETRKTDLVAREDLVYDLMQNLGGKWIVGGHSMGGGVAANIAIAHPDDVTGLLLFAPQTTPKVGKISAMLMRSVPIAMMYEAILTVASRMPLVIRMLLKTSFSDKNFAAKYDTNKIAKPLQIKGTGKGMAIMASHTTATDIAAFGALTIPIVIVTAKDDKIAVRSRIDELINSGAVNLTTIEFEKGGHMMMEYDPQAVAEKTLAAF